MKKKRLYLSLYKLAYVLSLMGYFLRKEYTNPPFFLSYLSIYIYIYFVYIRKQIRSAPSTASS